MSRFRGWTEDFQRFFIGLEHDNSKRYFDAHRPIYAEKVRAPMEALLAELEPEFGGGRIFRANRDTRFSANKAPYKTNIAADVGIGYVSLDARGLTAAAGHYHLDPEKLPRFREAIAKDKSGKELAAIVGRLEEAGYEVGGEDLKRVPRPWPQDHPRARLLRHKRLYYWRSFGLQPWLGTPAVKSRLAQVWRDGQPLAAWFSRCVG